MSITTLAEDPEDCPICLEQLKKKKAYAYVRISNWIIGD